MRIIWFLSCAQESNRMLNEVCRLNSSDNISQPSQRFVKVGLERGFEFVTSGRDRSMPAGRFSILRNSGS